MDAVMGPLKTEQWFSKVFAHRFPALSSSPFRDFIFWFLNFNFSQYTSMGRELWEFWYTAR